jgi:hypothetical protein
MARIQEPRTPSPYRPGTRSSARGMACRRCPWSHCRVYGRFGCRTEVGLAPVRPGGRTPSIAWIIGRRISLRCVCGLPHLVCAEVVPHVLGNEHVRYWCTVARGQEPELKKPRANSLARTCWGHLEAGAVYRTIDLLAVVSITSSKDALLSLQAQLIVAFVPHTEACVVRFLRQATPRKEALRATALHWRCYHGPFLKPRTVNATPPDVIMKPQPNTTHWYTTTTTTTPIATFHNPSQRLGKSEVNTACLVGSPPNIETTSTSTDDGARYTRYPCSSPRAVNRISAPQPSAPPSGK